MQVAVTESLLDRLEDCKRTFPTVAVLGGAGTVLPSCWPANVYFEWCLLPKVSKLPQFQQLNQGVLPCVCVGDVVTSRLSNGRAGITKVLQMDISAGMLQRDQATAQVLAFLTSAKSLAYNLSFFLLWCPSSSPSKPAALFLLLAVLLLGFKGLTHLNM